MKAKQLSELEEETMNIVWELQACSVRDVVNKITQTKQLAYTTIATILQRLYEKGLVKRKEDGAVIFYSPKISKEIYSRSMAQTFMSKFINSFGDAAIASFAESIEDLPKSKREYFLKLLTKHETK